MAELLATRASRGHRTLCLPFAEQTYCRIIGDPVEFRRAIDDRFPLMPELFPAGFAQGYRLKDDRVSAKQEVPIRRVILRDGTAYGVRPSFLMPYMTARTDDVQSPLFLRKFAVPFRALAGVFGRDPMYWYRIECGPGRFRLVGTTVRRGELPEHLLADGHHQTWDAEKVYVATTVGSGCIPGAEPAATAGTDDLKAAYSVFKQEARDIAPKYSPKTVNTDGGKGTKAAWKLLFKKVVILPCFLHAWLKIRDRGKHLKDQFAEISQRVWEAYHASDRRCFGQRLRSLRGWATKHPGGVVLEKVVELCQKRDRGSIAYRHPDGHRTSTMLDRLMRGRNRYFEHGQPLHGSRAACRLHCGARALLWNFAPWHPATMRENDDGRCPAERLNRHRYHEDGLQKLLISASLAGYRSPPPQNP
jgi:hypothetical protein